MKRNRETTGTFSITSPGIAERVSASAPSLGAALSKAQTIGIRLQRELRSDDAEEDVSISIRQLGDEKLVGRVDVHRDVIATSTFV